MPQIVAAAAAAPAIAATTAGATAAAAGTGAALTAGIAAGSAIGTGAAATSGLLGKLGLSALGGMQAMVPAAITAAPGITAALPAAAPGLLNTMGMSPLAGIKPAASGLFNTMGMNPMAMNANLANIASRAAPSVSQISSGFVPSSATSMGGAARVPTFADIAAKAPKTMPMGTEAQLAELAKASTANTEAARSAAQMAQLQQQAAKVGEANVYTSPIKEGGDYLSNLMNLVKNPSLQGAKDYASEHPIATAAGIYGAYNLLNRPKYQPPAVDKGTIRPYTFDYNQNVAAYTPTPSGTSAEQLYFDPKFTAQATHPAAEGGLMGYAVGGPVEQMAAMNAVGANTGYPMAGINTSLYTNPTMQRPEAVNVLAPSSDAGVGAYSGEPKFASGGATAEPKTTGSYQYVYDPNTQEFKQTAVPKLAPPSLDTTNLFGGMIAKVAAAPQPVLNTGPATSGGIASAPQAPQVSQAAQPGAARAMPSSYMQPSIPAYQTPEERLGLAAFYPAINAALAQMGGYAAGGGVSDLGNYSDGGRLLKGPGDGVSDSIPAVIGNKQPARLADGEFVIPARIVSELGNGSTEAGARKLYAMMERVQNTRKKSIGKKNVAVNSKADKHLPA